MATLVDKELQHLDLYGLLGVSEKASEKEVRAAAWEPSRGLYRAGRKKEGGGVTLGPPRQPLRVLEPCFLRRPDIACSWEVENKSVFFSFCFCAWIFASLCLY
uniref:Uncharacterized protein n=1 Tax=Bubo bubo TaxID=30461 RepID=A0A8C0I878_BUBBB